MKPKQSISYMWRNVVLDSLVVAAITTGLSMGCSSPLIRLQSPESEFISETNRVDEDHDLIGDVTSVRGMKIAKVEGIVLLTGLDGTGSDPPPSSKRSALVSEMQSHEVKNPSGILASPSTTMAIAYGYLRPGIRKGERFDVAVKIRSRSETTSLRGGYLMQARLREMALLDNMIHTGLPLALARGDVLVDSIFLAEDSGERSGRVLGGGVMMKNRPLGLAVRDGFNSVRTSAMIGAALNKRFHTFDRGVKRGIAVPKRDNYVELDVHPRYKHNITRYMQVVRAVPLKQNATDDGSRLETLRRKLHEPTTAARAAIELEALGIASIDILNGGLESPDALVRFVAAESLAYLDKPQAAAPLASAAREEIAFRWRALTALAAMEYVEAYDALTSLLDVPSAETRYGAFFSMRTRNPYDPMVRGESLGEGAFSYHVIPSDSEPMIHFTRYRRPEVVVFGQRIEFKPPAYLFVGKEVLLKANGDGRIRISRFRAGEEDQHDVCDPHLDAVVRAVVGHGADYADVLELVHEAKDEGYLNLRVEVNAMPKRNREYHPGSSIADTVGNQVPELFSNQIPDSQDESDDDDNYSEIEDEGPAKEGFFGRITSWLAP